MKSTNPVELRSRSTGEWRDLLVRSTPNLRKAGRKSRPLLHSEAFLVAARGNHENCALVINTAAKGCAVEGSPSVNDQAVWEHAV